MRVIVIYVPETIQSVKKLEKVGAASS